VDLKRRWKSLLHKVQHLRLELQDREEALIRFECEFNRELSLLDVEDIEGQEIKPLINSPIPQQMVIDPVGKEVQSAQQPTGTKDLKKLWRSIALHCHPDKTKNDIDLTQLYKTAETAWRSGCYDELYRIAIDLNLELPEYSAESIDMIIKISDDLQEQIKRKESNTLWVWGNSDSQQRLSIIDSYLQTRGKKRK